MIMKMRWGYTVDRTQALSRAICHITGGPFSHVFPIFYPDYGGAPVYYESCWKQDAKTGRDGVRGPVALDHVIEWQQAAEHRLFALQPADGYLPFSPAQVRAAEQVVLSAVGRVRYARGQILQNWLAQRTGIRLAFRFGSTLAWTCSETCIRLVPLEYWPHFRLPDLSPDDIPPTGERLVSLWSGTQALIKAAGVIR